MLTNIVKGVGIFFLVYFIWLSTGGPERGEQRRADNNDGLLIVNPLGSQENAALPFEAILNSQEAEESNTSSNGDI